MLWLTLTSPQALLTITALHVFPSSCMPSAPTLTSEVWVRVHIDIKQVLPGQYVGAASRMPPAGAPACTQAACGAPSRAAPGCTLPAQLLLLLLHLLLLLRLLLAGPKGAAARYNDSGQICLPGAQRIAGGLGGQQPLRALKPQAPQGFVPQLSFDQKQHGHLHGKPWRRAVGRRQYSNGVLSAAHAYRKQHVRSKNQSSHSPTHLRDLQRISALPASVRLRLLPQHAAGRSTGAGARCCLQQFICQAGMLHPLAVHGHRRQH